MDQSVNKSQQFLNAVDEIAKTPVPPEVTVRARRSLLDYLAVTCAGAAFQKEKIHRYLEFAMPEEGSFRAIGTGRSLAFGEAVFLNGLNAHALDFDDGTNSGIIHLGSPIFSLLLPLAQRFGRTVDDVLKAAVTGYEASYTMAVTIQPGHKALGYHATGTCGTLGATLAAAYMLDFTKEERERAFAAACVAAGGMLKSLDNGSELKPYNVAKASLMAMTALRMGKAGFNGDGDPLGGRGFLHMMTGRDDIDAIELKPTLLGGTYAIMKSYTKPYASCRYTHPPVEAAISLRDDVFAAAGVSDESEDCRAWIDAVDAIDIKTYSLAVGGHDHREIPGSYSAKMSTPYAVAAALRFGRAGLQEFTEEAVRDGDTLALTRKVSVGADEDFSAAFPGEQTAVMTIRMKDGSEFSRRVDFPKGEPENPMSRDEFKERYDALMAYGQVDPRRAQAVYAMVPEEETYVQDLVELL